MTGLHARLGAAVDADALSFSGVEFADARLSSVSGRVKRRRAARSAGVGGASVLGIGALAVGATHLPFASVSPPVPGSSGVVCTTTAAVAPSASANNVLSVLHVPSPSGSVIWAIAIGDDDPPLIVANLALDLTTHEVTGSIPDGNSLVLTPAADGTYGITFSDGNVLQFVVTDDDLVLKSASLEPTGAPTVACATPSPEPSSPSTPTSTPTPTPKSTPTSSPAPTSSPDASFDALYSPTPIAGTDPFQCGFEFPTDEQAADTFSVTGGKVPAPNMQALLTDKLGANAPTLGADRAHALMWRARLVGDPTASDVNAEAADSLTYVLAIDGIVIGTFEKGPDGAMDGVSASGANGSGVAEAFLWDKHGATECPGITGAVISVQTWVVAGSTASGEPIYAWKNITKD